MENWQLKLGSSKSAIRWMKIIQMNGRNSRKRAACHTLSARADLFCAQWRHHHFPKSTPWSEYRRALGRKRAFSSPWQKWPKRRKRAANNVEKRSQESFEKRVKSRKRMKKKYRNIRRQKGAERVIFIFLSEEGRNPSAGLKIHNHALLLPGQILTASWSPVFLFFSRQEKNNFCLSFCAIRATTLKPQAS